MKIVNLTPHALNFVNDANESVVTIPPSGTVARCAVHREDVANIVIDDDMLGYKIPVHKTVFGAVEGLPEPEPDTVYVVSSLVAQAVPDRSDVFAPDDFIRDKEGRIIGARALATMATSSDKISAYICQQDAERLKADFAAAKERGGNVFAIPAAACVRSVAGCGMGPCRPIIVEFPEEEG